MIRGRLALFTLVAALLAVAVSPLPGEVVTRRDGTRIAGKCRFNGKTLAVARGLTTTYIPLANIASVDLHPDEEREFEKMRATSEREGAAGYYRLGKWLDDHLQFARAETFYRRALEIDPDHRETRRVSGYRRRGREWVVDADAQLERASKGFGANAAQACVTLGKGYADEKNPSAAEKAFRRALIAEPTHAEAMMLIQPYLAMHKLRNEYLNPLEGRTAVVSGHGHRSVAYMYNAVDLVKVDEQGRFFDGDARRLESYLTYDAPVRAAADGEVFSVIDKYPDVPIGRPGDFLRANSVAIRHAGGEFTLYAHLRQGSTIVKKGERVKAGQLLGRVGNSGSTMTPHLHFCVYDADGISLPMQFAQAEGAK